MESLATINPRLLGDELQVARKTRGLTQQQAADELLLSRTTLVAIEQGARRLSGEEFLRMCRLYGRTAAEFLRRPPSSEGFQAQFRGSLRGAADGDDAGRRAIVELERHALNYLRLEELTGERLVRRYPPSLEVSAGLAQQAMEAESLAHNERNRLGVGDGPMLSLRARLENDVGLRVFYFPMHAKLAGLYGYTEELGGCIGINLHHPPERARWSLAHEYGHFLTTRHQSDFDVVGAGRGRGASEKFVDRFARCLLMPASGLLRRVSDAQRSSGGLTLAQVCSLASLFEVSVQAMVLRLEELSCVRAGTWESIVHRGFKAKASQAELGHPSPKREEPLPARYQALAVLAHEKTLLTEGELAEILGVGRLEARQFVRAFRQRINQELDGDFEQITSVSLAEVLS